MDDSDYTPNIGFQGVIGSFSHEALLEYFGGRASAVNYTGFKDIFAALEKGEINYGILPLENSSTGGITEVYDLLGEYGFFITGEKYLKVNQNLLGIKGTDISQIKEVYSHMQGFLQSKNYFDQHHHWKLIPYHNTAKSAMYVSRQKSKSKACVASRKAAEIYGLEVLKENINDNNSNCTRFIVIGRHKHNTSCSNKISIVTSLPHQVGSLYRLLKHFADNNSSLLKIESRPITGKPFEYLFYIDFQGNTMDKSTISIFNAMEADGLNYKFLGNYKAEEKTI